MRKFTGWIGIAVMIWAASATAFHLYSAYIGYLEPREQRSIHLLFFLPFVFILYPAHPEWSPKHRPSFMDCILAIVATGPAIYSYLESDRINLRLEDVDPLLMGEVVFGTIAVVLVIEALRRAVTPILAGILCVGLTYLFLCEYMPGLWNYRDMGYEEIIETMYVVNGHGIFGTITGISATMVAIFIGFGAFVEGTGIGRLFNNLGQVAAGRYSGGPAKVAVVTSAMFGTMSGSSSSNVFTTGSFTIPMMKRLGYRPQFAGGVEAAASVGGQSAPPIMGAGAFIMSEITNTPYADIIIAAALGAACYFTMLLISVHLEAKKYGLRGMDRDLLPSWKVVARDAHLLLPIGVLIVLLMMRFSPHFSAFYSILTAVVVSWAREHTRMTPTKLFNTLVTAGKNTASIAVACVGAGMIVASLTKTGLVISFGTIIAAASGGVLWIAGILLMFTTLLLGMGVPTTAAYVITASIGAPTLIADFGVPMLAAHLFVFYFAILADATPPVSIASYAAASIARANPILTGLQASRLAVAGYIVGFSYLYAPELRMEGAFFDIIMQLGVTIGGLTIVASGWTGFLRRHVAIPVRALLIPVGLGIALLHGYSIELRLVVAVVVLGALYLVPAIFSLGRTEMWVAKAESLRLEAEDRARVFANEKPLEVEIDREAFKEG